MSDVDNVAPSTQARGDTKKEMDRRHPVIKAIVAVLSIIVILLVAYAITMLVSSSSAQSDGEQVQAELQRLNEAIDNVNIDAIEVSAGNISQHLNSLKDNLDGWQWSIATILPGFGKDVVSARELVEISNSLADKVLVPAAGIMKDYSNEISTSGILAVFDSSLIDKVADALTEAAPAIQSANTSLEAMQPTGNEELDTAVAELREPVGKIADLLDKYGTLAGHIDDLKNLLPKA